MKKFSPKLHQVSFGAYTREEILKSSVLEVKTPLDFDDSDQPVENGIYDQRLGPFTQENTCGTCFRDYANCPGHLGHFMLPVPVFNPLFIKTLHQLLLGSCLQCHSLMAPLPLSLLLRAQLVALDSGIVNLVKEMDDVVHEILRNSQNNGPREVKEKLDFMLASAGRTRGKEYPRTSTFPNDYRTQMDIDAEDASFKSQMKNFAVYRQELVKKFTADHLLCKTDRCPHCLAPKPTIYNFGNVRFVYNAPLKFKSVPMMLEVESAKSPGCVESFRVKNVIYRAIINLKDSVDDPDTAKGSETDSDATTKKPEMIVLAPDIAQKHLTELWEKEKRILQQLYRILTSTAALSLPCPTDVFFLDVIAIPPPKFRPFCDSGHGVMEHPQSSALKKIMQTSLTIKNIMSVMKTQAETKDKVPQLAEVIEQIVGESPSDKLQNAWISLQAQINCFIGDDKDFGRRDKPDVILSQTLIEPKDENFIESPVGKSHSGNISKRKDSRKGVVGKIVNYAARTVTPWKELKRHDHHKSKYCDSLDLTKRTNSCENIRGKSRTSTILEHDELTITPSDRNTAKSNLGYAHSNDLDTELRRASFPKPRPGLPSVAVPLKLPIDQKFVQHLRNELKAEKEKSNRLEEKLRVEKERNSRLHLSLQKEMDRIKKIREIMRRESCDDYMILRGYSDTGSEDSIC